MKKIVNEIKVINLIIEIIIIIIILSLFASIALAANDPGHDSLYVLKVGDTISGNLNISQNLTITQNMTVSGNRIDTGFLKLYGDGSTISSGSAVVGKTGGDMLIESSGNLYLKWNTGGNNVYVGGSTSVALNVSGALYVGGYNYSAGKVCLTNGTNCPSTLGGANISANAPTAGYIAQFQSASILNNSVIIQSGSNIGIGATPTQTLHVAGSANITGAVYLGYTQTCQGANNVSVYNGTGFNCTSATGTTYTADNNTLTLTGTQFLLNTTWVNASYVRRGTWTDIDSYPAACAAGYAVTTIGDTLTCSGVNSSNSYTADNNTLTLTGTQFLLNTTWVNASYVRRGTWTDIDSYPAACAAGYAVTTIGDTLTCSGVNATSTDENNYTSAIAFGVSGTTTTLYENRTGMANITANFADQNNYTAAIALGASGGTLNIYLNRTGMANLTASVAMNDSTRALAGTCTGSQVIQNASATGVQCITPTGTTYTADNSSLTLTGTQFNFNTTYGDARYATIAKVGTLTNTYMCHGNGTAVQCDDSAVTMSTSTHTISATNFTCSNCIGGAQLVDTLALDANLAITGYNVSIDTSTFAVDVTNDRVGIGTATPSGTLDVAGTIKAEAGLNDNLLRDPQFNDMSVWTNEADNTQIISQLPTGEYVQVMQMNGITNRAMLSDYIPVDAEKTYKFQVWMSSNDTTTGNHYFGLYCYNQSKTVINCTTTAGAETSNPYFWSGDLGTADTYMLLTGYLFPYGSSGWTNPSDTTSTNFAMNSETAYVRMRLYHYPGGTVNVSTNFALPRVEEIQDGSIWSIKSTATTNYVIINPNYNVGIGTTTPSMPLDVESTSTSTSGIAYGIYSAVTGDPTAGGTLSVEGIRSVSSWSSDYNGSDVYGVLGYGVSEGNGNLTNVLGGYFSSSVSNTYTPNITNLISLDVIYPDAEDAYVNNAYGALIYSPTVDTGSIATAYGIRISSGSALGAGSITTLYPLYIAADSRAATTKEGLYMGTMSGATTNYQLYIAGTADSYFAGDIGIKSTTPDSTLAVAGNLSVTGTTNSSLDSGTLFIDATNNRVGLVTATPDAPLDVLGTSGQQLRLTYTDNSVFSNLTTDSGGNLTIQSTSGNVIIKLG